MNRRHQQLVVAQCQDGALGWSDGERHGLLYRTMIPCPPALLWVRLFLFESFQVISLEHESNQAVVPREQRSFDSRLILHKCQALHTLEIAEELAYCVVEVEQIVPIGRPMEDDGQLAQLQQWLAKRTTLPMSQLPEMSAVGHESEMP